MRKVFFVDRQGNELCEETIQSHIGLATYFLENSENLKTQYENRKNKDENIVEFLQNAKGFMKGSQQGLYRVITFNSRKISDEQRALLRGYYEDGYRLDDVYLAELRKKQQEKEKNGDER